MSKKAVMVESLKSPTELIADVIRLRFARPVALSQEKQRALHNRLVCGVERSAPLDRHGRTVRDARIDYEVPWTDQMLALALGEPASPWPNNCQAAVCLTHDVDRGPGSVNCFVRDVWYGFNWLAANMRGNRRQSRSIDRYFSLRRVAIDPYDNLYRWMELESELGVRSAFYFMSLSARHLFAEGNRYVLASPAVRRAIRQMHNNGWEVGLHARYHRPFSKDDLMGQKNRLSDILGDEVAGVRNHYLRVRFPETWFVEAQCDFHYASNMGWADTVGGFRSGTCWPYQPVAGSKLWEIPFQIMDASDLSKGGDEVLARFKRYLAQVKRHRGVFILDFHSNYFFDEVAPQVNCVYRKIIGQLRADPELWIATPHNVIRRLSVLSGRER